MLQRLPADQGQTPAAHMALIFIPWVPYLQIVKIVIPCILPDEQPMQACTLATSILLMDISANAARMTCQLASFQQAISQQSPIYKGIVCTCCALARLGCTYNDARDMLVLMSQ